MASAPFRFKKFLVDQSGAAHAVGTDSVLLGAWAETDQCKRVLDIGTGTGVVALQVAQRMEGIVDAIDIHEPSVQRAASNFRQSPWADRLFAHQSAVQDWRPALPYDLIVSNPPFFSETIHAPDPDRRAARSMTTLTLPDLVQVMERLLTPEGRFCVILPIKEGRLLCELAAVQGWYFTRITAVHPTVDKPVERLLIQFERNAMKFLKNHLFLRDASGAYADAYRRLTADFYLDF